MNSPATAPIVRMTGVSKQYPGVLALNAVDLELFPGEVHIVAGENGAGKSTLMKVLAGSVLPDSGVIELDGKPVTLDSPLAALRHGIATVYQELALCPHLSAAENIFLGDEPRGRILLDRKTMQRRAGELLARLGARCRPADVVQTLGTAQMQLVELARALRSQFRVLILDEPTAALSESEIKELFAVVRSLRDSGCAIAYISHRLEEFAEIGDRVTVMRNGQRIETMNVRDAAIPRIVSLMAGKDMSELFPARQKQPLLDEPPLLRVNGLCADERLRNISFELRPGEILGVAGLVGSGRTRLLRTLFGLERYTAGSIAFGGRAVSHWSPAQAIDAGMGLVPEDRKTQGLLLDQSVARNISIASLERVSSGPFVSQAREAELARGLTESARIKTPDVDTAVRTLSGGNQQKVVLARWLARQCSVLLLDEPARGVDVGARYEIFRLIARCADEGKAVILVSSYLPEILGMANRILVMYRGRVAAELSPDEATQEKIVHIASIGSRNG